MIRVIFFGTSDFAVPALKSLAKDERFKIVSVVSQPDRPVGRHAVITPPPVKAAALELNLPILQPEKLSEIKEILPQADIFVIISYGKILPQWLLDLSPNGVVNVHPSLLPRWRGPSPIQAAIAAGDKTTGVTIMKIDAEMDHGPILFQIPEELKADETGTTLHDRLAEIGAKELPNVLQNYLDDKIQPKEQDHAQATYCKILTRDDGKIDWTKSATEIERLVRAYNPWPGTWTEIDGKRLKILAARVGSAGYSIPCGDDSSLELVTVQPEGKKPMSGKDFISGRSLVVSC